MPPKYAHLPGLAVDQPDVFESAPPLDPSLIHAHSSAPAQDEPGAPDVERSTIDAKSAFDRFRHSAQAADFTGASRASGYADETVQEMLQRLVRETDALSQRIAQRKERAPPFEGASADGAGTSAEVAEGLRQLEARLGHLHTEAKALTVRPRDGDGVVADDLLRRLKAFNDASPSETSSKSNAKEYVQYELTYTPDRQLYNTDKRIVQLENRVAFLERLVGAGADGAGNGAGHADTGSLARQVAELREQVLTLRPEGAAIVERRLQTLVAQMEKQSGLQGAAECSAADMVKIEELYGKVQRLDAVATSIPLIADRLVSLQKFHVDAARASDALETVETERMGLESTLRNQKQLTKELGASLERNFTQSLANFDKLYERLSSVESALKA